MKKDGFVYFASPCLVGGHPIKIGWSLNPWSAVSESGRWTWLDIQLLATVRVEAGSCLFGTGLESLEAMTHRALLRHRIRREWFAPHPDVLAFVEAARAGCDASALLDLVLPLLDDHDIALGVAV